jgi:hypothetical protein
MYVFEDTNNITHGWILWKQEKMAGLYIGTQTLAFGRAVKPRSHGLAVQLHVSSACQDLLSVIISLYCNGYGEKLN